MKTNKKTYLFHLGLASLFAIITYNGMIMYPTLPIGLKIVTIIWCSLHLLSAFYVFLSVGLNTSRVED